MQHRVTRVARDAAWKLEIKRLYLPFLVHIECAYCNETITFDLRSDYLSHPKLGVEEELEVCCGHCGKDQKVYVTLDVTLQVRSEESGDGIR